MIETHNHQNVASISYISDGNHFTISDDFVNEGIPYYRGGDVTGHFFVENANPYFITEEAFKRPYMHRSHLRCGDVLLSIIGTIGELRLVGTDKPATCSCKLAILRPHSIAAEYLAVFLRSVHGRNQIERLTRGAVQKGILLEDMDQLQVCRFSHGFEERVVRTVHDAKRAFQAAGLCREQANTILLDALGLGDWTPPEPLTYTSSASNVLAAGRLDAQYYNEKYTVAEEILRNAGSRRFVDLSQLLPKLTNVHIPLYHDLSEGDVLFLCAEHVQNFSVKFDAEKRILKKHRQGELARTALREGDVLLTIKGRIGNAALVCDMPPDTMANINQDVALLRFGEYTPPVWYILAYLNSCFGRLQIEKLSTGAINPFLGLLNVRQIRIPLFTDMVMRDIAARTQDRVFMARHAEEQARDLLTQAKRAVEIAIEQSEEAALRFLDGG